MEIFREKAYFEIFDNCGHFNWNYVERKKSIKFSPKRRILVLTKAGWLTQRHAILYILVMEGGIMSRRGGFVRYYDIPRLMYSVIETLKM